jgi:transcriptional antiterminator NusG
VINFVGPKSGKPVPLRDSEIKRIFGEVERKEGREIVEIPFLKGDSVKVVSGPFIDFNGTVDEVYQDKQKVKVVVSIFGRPTPVELDFFQIEMIK